MQLLRSRFDLLLIRLLPFGKVFSFRKIILRELFGSRNLPEKFKAYFEKLVHFGESSTFHTVVRNVDDSPK